MTDASITTICSAIGLGITFLATEYFKYKRELMIREQNRKDRIADREAIAEVAEVAAAGVALGETRKQEILKEVKKVETAAQNGTRATMAGIRYAKEAIDTSNGIKTSLLENGVRLITEQAVQQVEIVNAEPIPVTETK